MDQVVEDTDWAVERLFGTPDDPKIPEVEDEEVANLVSMEHLHRAAGPIVPQGETAELGGLYRKHCATCHGVTGNGRGPTGAILNPYPRDYRMGIFKFKSTTRGAKPTREDLARSIREGIAGTAMVRIPELSEDDVQALVDYVIYLSWRGQVERQMIDAAMYDLDLAAGDRILRPESADLMDQELAKLSEEDEEKVAALEEKIDAELAKEVEVLVKRENPQADEDALADLVDERLEGMKANRRKEMVDGVLARVASTAERDLWNRYQQLESKELFEENWGYVMDSVVDVAGTWLEAEDEVTEVEDPGEIPVPANRAEFVAMMAGPEADALKASVARGHELFLSEAVGCAKCHGKEGKGDGQTTDYDDWTKDGTVNVGLDPKNTDQLVPLLARGALTPQNIRPRNFAEGVFRGGSDPEDLFRRIANGIAGTPMPAAPVIEGQFERQDIWHLINYIRSLDKSPEQTPDGAQPAVNEAAAL